MEIVDRYVVMKYDDRDGYRRYLLITRRYNEEYNTYVCTKKGIKNYQAFKKAYPECKLKEVINLEELSKTQMYINFKEKVPYYERRDNIALRNI